MWRGVNDYDRVILICSKNSLERKGVLNELERALEREAKAGGSGIVLPVRLDDYLFEGWEPEREDIADQVRSRVVADFRGAMEHETKFNNELSKLLKALHMG